MGDKEEKYSDQENFIKGRIPSNNRQKNRLLLLWKILTTDIRENNLQRNLIHSPFGRSGIWHWKMCYIDSEKWEMINNGRNWTAELEMIREGKLQVFGNIRSGYHQTNSDERRGKKSVPRKNKKATWNQALL